MRLLFWLRIGGKRAWVKLQTHKDVYQGYQGISKSNGNAGTFHTFQCNLNKIEICLSCRRDWVDDIWRTAIYWNPHLPIWTLDRRRSHFNARRFFFLIEMNLMPNDLFAFEQKCTRYAHRWRHQIKNRFQLQTIFDFYHSFKSNHSWQMDFSSSRCNARADHANTYHSTPFAIIFLDWNNLWDAKRVYQCSADCTLWLRP